METKICKQCGRELVLTSFKPYVSRSTGKYATNVGRHTLCVDCEAVESLTMRLLKRKEALNEGIVDEALEIQLNDVKRHYNSLVRKGLPPVTKHARLLLDPSGVLYSKEERKVKLHFVDSVEGEWVGGVALDPVMDELNRLLTMELTDIPDIYNDMLDDVRKLCVSTDGKLYSKVLPRYESMYNKVLERLADYEDNYQWLTKE